MTTQQEPSARPQRPRPVMRRVEVADVERVTPHMVRVSLSGEGLKDFALPGPGGHVRLFLPQPGQDGPSLPQLDAEGRLPEGTPRPLSRVYTPRRFDDATKRLDVDIVLHEGTDGPGSTWARGAVQGNKLMMTGPSGRPYIGRPCGRLVSHRRRPRRAARGRVDRREPGGRQARRRLRRDSGGRRRGRAAQRRDPQRALGAQRRPPDRRRAGRHAKDHGATRGRRPRLRSLRGRRDARDQALPAAGPSSQPRARLHARLLAARRSQPPGPRYRAGDLDAAQHQ